MTRLGLLSDSHGDAAVTHRAVALLLAAGVDRVLYLGDVGTEQVLDALAVAYPPTHPEQGQRVPVHVVFGNTDYQPEPLIRYARDLGNYRADMYEIALWKDTLVKSGKDLMFAINIPQESVTIPESIDAIRAALELQTDSTEGVSLTNKHLGMGK